MKKQIVEKSVEYKSVVESDEWLKSASITSGIKTIVSVEIDDTGCAWCVGEGKRVPVGIVT